MTRVGAATGFVLGCVMAFSAAGAMTVAFLPFEDNVKLGEAWDLSVDIPRWYSVTVDTIGDNDSLLAVVPFDSVLSLIERNGWKRATYMSEPVLARIALHLDARYVVSGNVDRFKVVKRAINTDGTLTAQHSISEHTVGAGGATVMAGLQSYRAEVSMSARIMDGITGKPVATCELSSNQKTGGLEVWLPIQTEENAEWNFYHMRNAPFGSVYFHRSVLGAVMKDLSLRLHQKIAAVEPPKAAAPVAKEFVEGKVLGRINNDIYINLGTDDHLFLGEMLEVLKPQKAFVNEKGDTLGWSEAPVGTITIRSLKASHFALAGIVEEIDSIQPGWTVRPKRPQEQ